MARLEQIAEQLRELSTPVARDRLLAKGLSRGFIWKDGVLPDGSPAYGRHLTGDLLDYGYSVLVKALRLYENNTELAIAKNSLRFAAECIESAVRRGNQDDHRGFHLLISAAAFHLAGYAARSFCLLEEEKNTLNLSSVEKILMSLLRKELKSLRRDCFGWLNYTGHTDIGMSEAIKTMSVDQLDIELDNILVKALSRQYIESIALFEYALSTGKEAYLEEAKVKISDGLNFCAEICHIPQWWIHKLSLLLIDDIWGNSLHKLLPISPNEVGTTHNWNVLRTKYIAILGARDISETSLWPSQLKATARVLDSTDDLVVALPTSAGKTKIAEMCILRALSLGKRAIYITPLRALSAQIEKRLSRSFCPMGFSVSSLYGASGVTFEDVSTLKENQIVVATPEKLDFALRQDQSLLDDIGIVVLDEGHMIGLGTREIRYEVLVQRLLQRNDADNRRIVCLSAIFSSANSFDDFTAWLRSDMPGQPVHSRWRPTRQRVAILPWGGDTSQKRGWLRFRQENDFEEAFIPRFLKPTAPYPGNRRKLCPSDPQELTLKTAEKLIQDGHKVLVYCPQKRSVEPLGKVAIKLKKQGLFEPLIDDKSQLEKAIAIGQEWLGSSHIALACLRLGIGIHHGGLPRPFLSEIESLLDNKILPLVIASPTMAQGIDLTCSALVFHSIYQFRSGQHELISDSEYSNVIGRVGRAFVDLDGLIVFPIFKPYPNRIEDIKRLISSSSDRRLVSGLIQLIDELIRIIKEKIGAYSTGFEEYILNHNFDWNLRIDETDNDNFKSSDHFLDSLDNAILATVENLNCDITELADILEQALQSSLWQRQLTHLTDEVKLHEQKAVLVSRAKWLWQQSTPVQRMGFFSAGIGHNAGRLLEENIDDLISCLISADQALANKEIGDFVSAIQDIAVKLFNTYPYNRRNRPDQWQIVLKLWLSGDSLESLGGDTELISCIQEDFVFRLVWGVEAIRAYAKEIGRSEVDKLSGTIPLAITYGVPSRSAALLLQWGLPSRRVAKKVLEKYPAEFRRKSDVARWMHQIDSASVRSVFDHGSADALIWNDFASRFFATALSGPKPIIIRNFKYGSDISFVAENDITIVTTPDLRPLKRYNFDSRNLSIFDVRRNGDDITLSVFKTS